MEREVGGGIGMGNTCKSMADSFQCMTKSTTIKKKKNTHATEPGLKGGKKTKGDAGLAKKHQEHITDELAHTL